MLRLSVEQKMKLAIILFCLIVTAFTVPIPRQPDNFFPQPPSVQCSTSIQSSGLVSLFPAFYGRIKAFSIIIVHWLLVSDWQSGAVHPRQYQRRYFVSSPATSGSAAAFLAEKAAALRRCFLRKFFPVPLLLINSSQDFFDSHFHTLPFGVFILRVFSVCFSRYHGMLVYWNIQGYLCDVLSLLVYCTVCICKFYCTWSHFF